MFVVVFWERIFCLFVFWGFFAFKKSTTFHTLRTTKPVEIILPSVVFFLGIQINMLVLFSSECKASHTTVSSYQINPDFFFFHCVTVLQGCALSTLSFLVPHSS